MNLQESSYRSRQPWNEWDVELNDKGGWLIVGALTCASLPSFVGLIGLFALLYYAIVQSEPKARAIEIFKRRDNLKRKDAKGELTDEECAELDNILGILERTKSKRNTTAFTMGYLVWALVFAYQIAKMLKKPTLDAYFFG